MSNTPNYRLIATTVGEMLKYTVVLKDVELAAGAIFRFPVESFSNDNITSSRSKAVYDWIMTLAKQQMIPTERNNLLIQFCKNLVPEDTYPKVAKLMQDNGIDVNVSEISGMNEFNQRNLHPEIHKHSKQLYRDGHYFHAVFEATKVYNKLVREKAQEKRDGESLMLAAWAPSGVLKITPCLTETDINVQDGIKFLSAGLMKAIRNPTAHEPAIEWPISKEDCLNILSFMTFLFQKLDQATYYKANP